MWIEKRKDHYRMYERYTDPITGKRHKVSVRFDKDTTQQRYKARERLDALINSRSEYRYDCTFKTLTEAYLACKEKEVKPSTHRRNEAECYPQAETFTNPENNGFSGFFRPHFSPKTPFLRNFAPRGQVFGN